jgi:predicted ABC-type ATPase
LHSIKSSKTRSLRLRIFAGPNGSGKSTIIQAVREYRIKEIPVDFGTYVNADDIAYQLRQGAFSFSDYGILTTRHEFISMTLKSGLIGRDFTEKRFRSCFKLIKAGHLILKDPALDERLAQILADFLRKKLLQAKRKFSFETVFSHRAKLDITDRGGRIRYE